MEEKDLELQLLDMLKNKELKKLRSVLDTLEPADIAEMMESLYDDDKLKEEDLPRPLRGAPIVLIAAALMSIAFMGFSGLSL